MKTFQGKTLSWRIADGAIELTLDHAPCNEIGLAMLADLEHFVAALGTLKDEAHALIIASARSEGFCAGGDLRELFRLSQEVTGAERWKNDDKIKKLPAISKIKPTLNLFFIT